jgi:hypothetical protein
LDNSWVGGRLIGKWQSKSRSAIGIALIFWSLDDAGDEISFLLGLAASRASRPALTLSSDAACNKMLSMPTRIILHDKLQYIPALA